jgi:hypothetical protein
LCRRQCAYACFPSAVPFWKHFDNCIELCCAVSCSDLDSIAWFSEHFSCVCFWSESYFERKWNSQHETLKIFNYSSQSCLLASKYIEFCFLCLSYSERAYIQRSIDLYHGLIMSSQIKTSYMTKIWIQDCGKKYVQLSKIIYGFYFLLKITWVFDRINSGLIRGIKFTNCSTLTLGVFIL